MPPRPRFEAAGASHHVVPQGNARAAFVRDDKDRRAYLTRFYDVATRFGWTIHAHSLLDTHQHAVVTTRSPDLARGMRLVLGGHARWFNARHHLEGAVFADRYWSRRAESHLVRACIYALLNPVAAGLVRHPREWPWSSWTDLERNGCSDAVRERVGSDEGFLDLVESALDRLHAARARSGRSLWDATDVGSLPE